MFEHCQKYLNALKKYWTWSKIFEHGQKNFEQADGLSIGQKTISVRRYDEPLNKYVYLNDLLCTNERLFYKLLSENVEELMPIVYTPTVGLACQKFGYIFSKPQVNIAVL
mgnify:CR=1 FL=1